VGQVANLLSFWQAGNQLHDQMKHGDLTIGGGVEDLDYLLDGGVLEAFAALFQVLAELHGDFLHGFVGLAGTAHEEEMLAFAESLVSVLVIQADADKAEHAAVRGVAAVLVVRHGFAPFHR
jgi:hypothetical protein